MERITVIGNVGSIVVDSRQNKADGTTFKVASMRIAASTRKKSRSGPGFEMMTTWYEAEASGREAEAWERFSKGDQVVVSAVPLVEAYIKKSDGSVGFTIYLQQCVDVAWVSKKQDGASNGNGNGATQVNNHYAHVAAPAAAPDDDDF